MYMHMHTPAIFFIVRCTDVTNILQTLFGSFIRIWYKNTISKRTSYYHIFAIVATIVYANII